MKKGLVKDNMIIYVNDNINVYDDRVEIGVKENIDYKSNKSNSFVIEVEDYFEPILFSYIDNKFVDNVDFFIYQEKLKEIKIEEIKKVSIETRNKIIKIANEDKQRTYLAFYNNLLEKKFDGNITKEELFQMNELKILWSNIEKIRNDGNTLENSINKSITIKEVYDLIKG